MLAAMAGWMPRALADPESDVVAPPDPPPAAPIEVFALPFPLAIPDGTPVGQDPTPFTGTAPFDPPVINPSNASMVGVAMPIIVDFGTSVADRAAAEQAIHVSSDPPVPGKF
jgi:hypothetical protein